MNRRTILFADCGSGVLIAVLGALATTPATVGQVWWLVVATGILTGTATYVDEQRLEGAGVRKRVAVYALAAGLLVALLAAVVVTTTLGPGAAMTVGIVGFGLATFTNRLVFGVVYPIPQTRLRRAEQYSM